MPHSVWQEQRCCDLLNAMRRYVEANKDIPCEWVKEYLSYIQGVK